MSSSSLSGSVFGDLVLLQISITDRLADLQSLTKHLQQRLELLAKASDASTTSPPPRTEDTSSSNMTIAVNTDTTAREVTVKAKSRSRSRSRSPTTKRKSHSKSRSRSRSPAKVEEKKKEEGEIVRESRKGKHPDSIECVFCSNCGEAWRHDDRCICHHAAQHLSCVETRLVAWDRMPEELQRFEEDCKRAKLHPRIVIPIPESRRKARRD
jgi:hypothetical protein